MLEREAKQRWILGDRQKLPWEFRVEPVRPSVPVCAGRGDEPPCKHYRHPSAAPPSVMPPTTHVCMALYDVVTGDPLMSSCAVVRSFQAECGRDGKLYEAADKLAVEEAKCPRCERPVPPGIPPRREMERWHVERWWLRSEAA